MKLAFRVNTGMAGVMRLVTPTPWARHFSTSGRRLKDAAAQEIKGTPYNKLTIGVPKETWANEKRVALSPAVTAMLTKKGFTVHVEEGAGRLAQFRDEDYAAEGAKIVKRNDAFQQVGR